MEYTKMSYLEILQLPYTVYFGLHRQFFIMKLESTPEGRQMLEQSRLLHETKADISKIRSLNVYKSKKEAVD